MLDTTQVLLVIFIVLVGSTLVLVGIRFYLVLRAVQKNIENFNKILEKAQESLQNVADSTEHFKRSVGEVEHMAQDIRKNLGTPMMSGIAAFGALRMLLSGWDDDDDDNEEE